MSTAEACSVNGCRRPYGGRRGLCHMHYERWRRTGDVGPAEAYDRTPPGAPCTVAGCDRLTEARGMCNAHVKRWRRGSVPLGKVARQPVAASPCSLPGCDRLARGRGLCQAHYHQQRRRERKREAAS